MIVITVRILAGLALATVIAAAALRARSLSRSGAFAATALGTIAIGAGWGWGALLIAYFVLGSALSRWRSTEKAARTGTIVEKGGARDASQVLANGGIFALAALGSVAAQLGLGRATLADGAFVAGATDAPLWLGAAGAGALAAAAADTWATELGTLAPGRPLSLRTFRRVDPGTSGAVSARGTIALVLGAVVTGGLARLLGVAPVLPAIAGGVAGAVADTLLGAAVQARRWCARCQAGTERRVHDCGTATTHAGGIPRLDNDLVNVACAALGAVVSVWLAARMGS